MVEDTSPVFVTDEDMRTAERNALEPGKAEPLSALCLSGGGVRSAAFCLGVLQALARRDLLDRFHYLSTVSGGGYIGAFLRRALAERDPKLLADPEAPDPPPMSDAELRAALRAILLEPSIDGSLDSPEIKALRSTASFLVPNPGLASLDTWAGIVLWLRNTLVNWVVFLPLLMAATAVVLGYAALVTLAGALASNDPGWGVNACILLGGAGAICQFIGTLTVCQSIPSHYLTDPDHKPKTAPDLKGQRLLGGILAPVWIWVLLVPLAAALWFDQHPPLVPAHDAALTRLLQCEPGPAPPCATNGVAAAAVPIDPPPGQPDHRLVYLIPLAGFAASLLGFEIARLIVSAQSRYVGAASKAVKKENRDKHREAFDANRPAWFWSGAVSAGLLALGLHAAMGRGVLVLVLAGPPFVVLCEILRSTVYVALRRYGLRTDLDREWLARLSAAKLGPVVAVAAFATAVLLPDQLFGHDGSAWAWLVPATTFLSGPIAALAGRSIRTAFAPAAGAGMARDLPIGLALTAVALIFAAGITAQAGRWTAALADGLVAWSVPFMPDSQALAPGIAVVVVGMLCGGLSLWLDRRVNLNRFSMHAVYRNRLVRGFLGPARSQTKRHPEPFTRFDAEDNVRLADCWTHWSARRLFPVFNLALNETISPDTARSERKAVSFTMTPLHCGAASLEGRCFVPTRHYAGGVMETGPCDKMQGVTLGTAITLSGAAVSPNMGYQSSPALAFVMTLFNVRLGAWLPNPSAKARPDATNDDMNQAGPRYGLLTMLNELAGRSGPEDDFVYLSDGGHFDNLGCYEMLRRRCSLILVVDSGRDEKYGYRDLGALLQRARIDFGIKVSFLQPMRTNSDTLQPHGAFAEITYPEKDKLPASKGRLIYLKPWLPTDLPAELKAFKALKQSFPYETTLDQFFTESDFESYRRLGECLTDALLDTVRLTVAANLDSLFDAVHRKAMSAPGAAPGTAPGTAPATEPVARP